MRQATGSAPLVTLQYRGPVADEHGLTEMTERLMSLRDGDVVEVKVIEKELPTVGPTRHVRKILGIAPISLG